MADYGFTINIRYTLHLLLHGNSECPSFTRLLQTTISYSFIITELVCILTFERQRQDRARQSVHSLILLADVLRRQSLCVGVRNCPTMTANVSILEMSLSEKLVLFEYTYNMHSNEMALYMTTYPKQLLKGIAIVCQQQLVQWHQAI